MRNRALFMMFNLLCLLLFSIASAQGQKRSNEFDCTTVTQIAQAECEALVALDVANPSNGLPTSWFSNLRPCSWARITCDSAMTTIIELNLNSERLTSLPPEFGNLSNLSSLYLSSNELTSLPPEFGNLSNLEVLFMHANQLTGLPLEFSNLSNLSRLNMSSNELTSLSSEFGNLSNLSELDLNDNQLTDLPSEITDLTPTSGLDIQFNSLCITSLAVATWLDSYGQSYADRCLPDQRSIKTRIGEMTTIISYLILLMGGVFLLGIVPVLRQR